MASTFGVTAALLEARRLAALGVATSGKTGTDVAQTAIDETADDVDVELRAAGIDPDTITETDAPVSYRWLQTTILYGAAVAYLHSATGQPELASSYLEEYRRRMGRLRGEPDSVLVDLPQPTGEGGQVSVYR